VETRVLEASIVVIGDEILGGYVTDANSPWLADRLRANGVPLTRVHVVPDEFEAIDEALQAELARSRPRVVFTTGGIGSTPDDITYEAVAASLDRGLVEDPVIAERIDQALRWTQAQGVDVDEAFEWHLKRMARVPAGTRLLLDGSGWTPGLAVDVDGGSDGDGATIVILPGVPHLLRAIIADVVEPNLLVGRNVPPTVVEVEHGFPESALNLTFVELMDRYPDVKLGSYPGDPMLIRLSGDADEVAGAERLVRGALDDLLASPAGARLQQAWTRRLARHDDSTEEGA
jgi:molybdenum cofactor synthesis domain-containing protein